MKKIFIGGIGSCDTRYEKFIIYNFLKQFKCKITYDYYEADYIFISETCIGAYKYFCKVLDFIKLVNSKKKDDAEIIITGCVADGVKFPLTHEQYEILNLGTIVKSEDLAFFLTKLVNQNNLDETNKNYSVLNNADKYRMSMNIVQGCLNQCSFCKTNYMNFNLKSTKLEDLAHFSDYNERNNALYHYLNLYSSNLSLYGVDLYGRPRAHEAIHLLTKPDFVKYANVGALINWYPELLAEILNNEKIKSISVSLESGSTRLYKTMNRPISLSKWVDIIKLIRRDRPDILINTEIICGYPTETIVDLKMTLDLLYTLDINVSQVHGYINSPQLPISSLAQHSQEYVYECVKYMKNKLLPLNNRFDSIILNGEMLVLLKDDEYKCYYVMLTDGSIMRYSYDKFSQKYNEYDVIPANSILARKLTLK